MKEAPEFLEYDYDKNELYQVENMILEENKEKIERHKVVFERKQKITYGIEDENYMKLIQDKEVNKQLNVFFYMI